MVCSLSKLISRMVILLLQQEKQNYSSWEPENSEHLHQGSLHNEKLFAGGVRVFSCHWPL
jgi:hypothetical protein